VELYLHFHNMSLWCGAQLKRKHSENFTVTFKIYKKFNRITGLLTYRYMTCFFLSLCRRTCFFMTAKGNRGFTKQGSELDITRSNFHVGKWVKWVISRLYLVCDGYAHFILCGSKYVFSNSHCFAGNFYCRSY
jgi:hypothetical protein